MTTPLEPFFTDATAIHEWLAQFCDVQGSITIHDNGDVSVQGSVFYREVEGLPSQFRVQFKTVSGHFHCNGAVRLRSLHGAPTSVGGNFNCSNCEALTSLEGGPMEVLGDCSMHHLPGITCLNGAPDHVGKGFYIQHCGGLIDLRGGPQSVGGGYYADFCGALKSLQGLPTHMGDNLSLIDVAKIDLALPPNAARNFVIIANAVNLTTTPPESIVTLLQHLVTVRTFNHDKIGSAIARLLEDNYVNNDYLATIIAFEALYGTAFLPASSAMKPEDSSFSL